MKILFVDLETAPNLASVWGIWQQNISLDMLISSGYTLCYSASWLDSDEVFFDSTQHKSPKAMLRGIHKLLDEADAVVTYNGDKFDIPTLNKDFVLYGYTPPSPTKSIDLYKTIKAKFRLPSNKLEYVVKFFEVGEKLKHIGYDLWKGVMAGDKNCWKLMEEYNIRDTVVLKKLYLKILPWVPHHANYSIHNAEDALCCPNCGSTHLVKRGFYRTEASEYQRYKCVDCGKWLRDNKILNRNRFRTVGV